MRTIEPTSITKGEFIEWTRSFCDYPATEYELQYRFRGDGAGVNVDATADGDDFVSELTAAASATMATVKYEWQAWLTEIADPTNTFVVAEGLTTVKAGFTEASLAAVDNRTPAKIMLDTIDAALLASGSADVIEYEITTPAGGRRVKREARSTVLEQRKYWAGIVARENAAKRVKNGGKFGKAVKVVMREQ